MRRNSFYFHALVMLFLGFCAVIPALAQNKEAGTGAYARTNGIVPPWTEDFQKSSEKPAEKSNP